MSETDKAIHIVSLLLRKDEPGKAVFSLSQSWGMFASEDEAVGSAIRWAAENKPGFSVSDFVISSPPLQVIVTPTQSEAP